MQTNTTIKPEDVARNAFWSLRHPLNEAMRRHVGETFSLRQLIQYARDLPPEMLHDYAGGGDQVRFEIEGA